jgi:hypothetical protein
LIQLTESNISSPSRTCLCQRKERRIKLQNIFKYLAHECFDHNDHHTISLTVLYIETSMSFKRKLCMHLFILSNLLNLVVHWRNRSAIHSRCTVWQLQCGENRICGLCLSGCSSNL